MVKIIVDCFGGDHSPEANIEGAINALNKHEDLFIVFSGDEDKINACLKNYKYDPSRIEILDAKQVIEVSEKPTEAIRTKRESSLVKGLKMLREDESCDALISNGSSGAVVAGAMLRIGRIKGVFRPAFCPILPTMNNGVVAVCDSGANVDTKSDMLFQYGIMASTYIKKFYNIENPKVALLNVGVEEDKGDDTHKEAYQLLKNCKNINFVGNMESRDLLSGKYDVVVCDGFSGNVLIKTTEGTAKELLKRLKKDMVSSFKNKLGALLLKKTIMKEVEFMNYQNYGGSVIIGLDKIVIKAHGSSKAKAIEICVEQAYKLKETNINKEIELELSKINN